MVDARDHVIGRRLVHRLRPFQRYGVDQHDLPQLMMIHVFAEKVSVSKISCREPHLRRKPDWKVKF